MPKPTPKLRPTLKKTAEKVDLFLSSPRRLVFFFDEGRFGVQPHVARYWARQGVRPYATVNPDFQNFYLYSSVSPHIGQAFTLFLPWVNTDMMNLYLDHLAAAYPHEQLLLIMDRAGWHQSKGLTLPHNIQIDYLPAYSPALNPVEKLWQWLRRHACRNRCFDSEDQLVTVLEKSLMRLSTAELSSLCGCS